MLNNWILLLECRAIVTLNKIIIAPTNCIPLTDSFNTIYPATIATKGSIFKSRDVFVEPTSDMQWFQISGHIPCMMIAVKKSSIQMLKGTDLRKVTSENGINTVIKINPTIVE